MTLEAPDTIAHLDWAPECQWQGCDPVATWLVRGRCPHCGHGVFTGGETLQYACDTQRTTYLLHERDLTRHPRCGEQSLLGDVLTWRWIGRRAVERQETNDPKKAK